MTVYNLDPVTKLTTGAVGEPGERTFYLQARSGDEVLTLLVEKGQVDFLARHVQALLSRLEETRPGEEEPEIADDDLALDEPLEPAFRVGAMALGFDAERNLVLLQCDELVAEAPDEAEEELPDLVGDELPAGSVARFWATRRQMRALARRGAEAVAAGRPTCRLCGQPIAPEGHQCAAMNGHRELRDQS